MWRLSTIHLMCLNYFCETWGKYLTSSNELTFEFAVIGRKCAYHFKVKMGSLSCLSDQFGVFYAFLGALAQTYHTCTCFCLDFTKEPKIPRVGTVIYLHCDKNIIARKGTVYSAQKQNITVSEAYFKSQLEEWSITETDQVPALGMLGSLVQSILPDCSVTPQPHWVYPPIAPDICLAATSPLIP